MFPVMHHFGAAQILLSLELYQFTTTEHLAGCL